MIQDHGPKGEDDPAPKRNVRKSPDYNIALLVSEVLIKGLF
jgi:hypothetical protein